MRRTIAALLFVALSAFGAGRELSPSSAGPTANSTGPATTVFSRGRFLTIWREAMGGIGTPVMGILHDERGQRISSRAIPLLPSVGWVHLVEGGDAFALFWSDLNGSYLTDVDRNGNVRGTTTLDVYVGPYARIAWNGTRYLIVGTTTTLLTRSGAVAANATSFPNSVWAWSVAPASRGFTIASYETEGTCVRRISNAGDLEWSTCVAPSLIVGEAPVSIAVADRGVLVVWGGADGVMRSAIVRDGVAGPIHVLANGGQKRLLPVAIGPAGDRFLVTFREDQWPRRVLAIAVNANGTALSDAREVTPQSAERISAASSGMATLAVFGNGTSVQRSRAVVIANNATAGPEQDVMIGPGVQSQPALADIGAYLLAVWSDEFESDAQLWSSAMNPSDEQLWRQPVDDGRLLSSELPSNGTEVLILSEVEVENREKQLKATFADLSGNSLDDLLLGETAADWVHRRVSAVWTGEHWLVAWTSRGPLDFDVAVVRDHRIVSTQHLALPTPLDEDWGRGLLSIALARNATTTLFVWTEQLDRHCSFEPPCAPTKYRTYAARMNTDGTFAGPALELPAAAQTLSIATSGDEFVVVAGGTVTVLDSGARRILHSTELVAWDEAAGDVTWTGSDYAVAMRYRLAKWYLSVTHLDRRGNVIGTPNGIETLPAQKVAAPSIARSVIALQEGHWTTGTRAVVYEEAQLAPLPPPPADPVPRVELDTDGWYIITWDPVPGAEGYLVELPEGALYWTNTIFVRAGMPLRVDSPTASVRVTAVGPGGSSVDAPRRRVVRR